MREERRRGSPCQPGRSIWARQPGRGGCRCACDGRRQHLPPTPHPLPDILSDLLAEMAPCPKAAAADRSAGWGGVPSTAPRADPGSTRELQPGLLAAPSHLDGGGSAAAPPPPHADWSGQGKRPRGGTEAGQGRDRVEGSIGQGEGV